MPVFHHLWFHPGNGYPLPLSWKNSSDLLLPLGNIVVHSLVFHPRPKASLCLSIPLVTSYLSANPVLWSWTEHWGVTSAPVPTRSSAACDLIWERFTLSPHHQWTQSTSRETYNILRTAFSQQGGYGGSLVCSCSTLDTSCTPQRETVWTAAQNGNIWKDPWGQLQKGCLRIL